MDFRETDNLAGGPATTPPPLRLGCRCCCGFVGVFCFAGGAGASSGCTLAVLGLCLQHTTTMTTMMIAMMTIASTMAKIVPSCSDNPPGGAVLAALSGSIVPVVDVVVDVVTVDEDDVNAALRVAVCVVVDDEVDVDVVEEEKEEAVVVDRREPWVAVDVDVDVVVAEVVTVVACTVVVVVVVVVVPTQSQPEQSVTKLGHVTSCCAHVNPNSTSASSHVYPVSCTAPSVMRLVGWLVGWLVVTNGRCQQQRK